MSKIKICGLTRDCDIEYANLLCPDYIGFVFVPERRRYISPQKAGQLRAMLKPGISAVGVFVDEPISSLLQIVKESGIDMIQLHGQENEAYLADLRAVTDKPMIKAFRIDRAADLEKAMESSADYILLDNGIGGTGTAFDWSLLKEIGRPYFLAGGLHAGNMQGALASFQPYAVDVSSGVETDGYKDFAKMEQLITLVKDTENREEKNRG